MPCNIQDLSSPTRDGSCAPCSVLTTGLPGMPLHQGFLYLPCQEFMHILHPYFLAPHSLCTPSHPHTHPWPYCNISQGKDQIRSDQISCSVVSDSATPWIAARQASLSITNSRRSLRLTSIESVMPSSHLILCRPLLFLSVPRTGQYSQGSCVSLCWWTVEVSACLTSDVLQAWDSHCEGHPRRTRNCFKHIALNVKQTHGVWIVKRQLEL